MFDGLRLRLGLAYSRFHFRKQKDQATRFSSALSRSRRALVVLPERLVDRQDLQHVLSYVSERFPADATAYVVRQDLRSDLPQTNADRTHSFSPDDLTSFYTPRPSLLQKVKSGTFDVAIDLNREFFLPSAFICKASGAPVRVSFTKDHADAFYNLQVQTHGPANQSAYKNLLRCLEMF